MNALVLVVIFAVLLERFIQVVVKPMLQIQGPLVAYVALVLGVAAAVGFQIDVFSALGISASLPLAGQIATGLVIAGGSNYANDVISLIRQLQGAPENLTLIGKPDNK